MSQEALTEALNKKNERCVVRRKELEQLLSLSRSAIYRLVAEQKLARPFPLVPGGRAVGWLWSDVQKYLDAQIQSRGSAA